MRKYFPHVIVYLKLIRIPMHGLLLIIMMQAKPELIREERAEVLHIRALSFGMNLGLFFYLDNERVVKV